MAGIGGEKSLILIQAIFTFLLACFCFFQEIEAKEGNLAILLNLSGVIGPATASYVEQGIDYAISKKANVVILQINTPGGLDYSMRLIISRILTSSIPIVAYVAPSGARAASAGTFILYASHFTAMAPGTNLGAATPISLLGSETRQNKEQKQMTRKEANDASAYIRSLAQLRHRNIAWSQKAVLEGASISANEAVALNVIDFIALDINDLLAKLNGKGVNLENKRVILNTHQISILIYSPNWRSHFLAIITDPNIAYILLLIGVYGLLFEFMNPGFILPGVAGLISLLIALYAFQLLPINYVGLALLFLGIGFMITEIFLPTLGTIGIGGVIAFIIGSIMLFDKNIQGFSLILPVIIMISLVTVGFFSLIYLLALKVHRKPIVSGLEQLIGSKGNVIILNGNQEKPRIRIRGELWQIRSKEPLKEGDKVRVLGIDELKLIVVPDKEKKRKE